MKKQHLRDAIIISLVITPIVLLFFPANYFDNGQTICPSKLFLTIDCFGCGLSRSTQHLVHFQFKKAWEFNRLIIIVFPLLFYYWIIGIKHIFLIFKKAP